MTDKKTQKDVESTATKTEAQAQPEVVFSLQRTYVKDMSVEVPNSPEIFLEEGSPDVEMGIQIGGKKVNENGIFEVTLRGTITTKLADKVVYVAEVLQAGIFEIRNIPEEQLDPLLGIACPSILFPYLRAQIADSISRTSFPAFHMAEINFQALYEQRQAQLMEEAAKAKKQ